jgi:hypothetical protein
MTFHSFLVDLVMDGRTEGPIDTWRSLTLTKKEERTVGRQATASLNLSQHPLFPKPT